MDNQHIMNLVYEHEGTEEWVCPSCGRKLIIEWNPFKKEVLVEGDSLASHTGSKGLYWLYWRRQCKIQSMRKHERTDI